MLSLRCILFLHVVVFAHTLSENGRALILSYKKGATEHFQYLQASGYEDFIDISIVSVASFSNEIEETGWTSLSLMSSDKYADHIQAYWSGFLETNVTYEVTVASWLNTIAGLCISPLSEECSKLHDFLTINMEHTIKNAMSYGAFDEFWYQVGLQMWQLRGISDAYKKLFVEDASVLTDDYLLTLKDEVLGIYLLQLSGDLSEILQALRLHGLRRRLTAFGTTMVSPPSCSALIKLIEGDVFLSHVTWSPYSQMLRVLKHYNFPWKRTARDPKQIPGSAISFSSYPSVISSVDDFYVTSGKLVVMETTIGNYNEALWPFVKNRVRTLVLEPFRVMAANRLAHSGSDWVDYFKQRNSGTYNNQWMVFDAKVYSPGKPLPDNGLLVVAEQLPNLVYHMDVTSVLKRQTYWASYNLPYFPVVYNMSGVPNKVAKYGDWYDYDKNPRAQMFLRDHHKVTNLASMHRLMRYNDFENDPLSRCECTPPFTGENGISARSDLNDPAGTYPVPAFEYRLHGGTDVKITNYTMIHTLNMLATAGPTYDNVRPFDWSKLPIPVPKPRMHPTKWMFQPILTNFADYQLTASEIVRLEVPKLKPIFV